MIISFGRNYIFVHAPKTGGTAMALALEARAMKDDILVGDTPKAVRRRNRLKALNPAGRLWKHSTLADIEGIVTRQQMADMCVFTMTRNPWDRLVSYYHWLQGQNFGHPAVGLAQSMSFPDFLRHPSVLPPFTSQPIAAMTTDRAGMNHANYVIALETWERDVAPLNDLLGFEIALTQVNTSPRDRDYRSYYNDIDAALVANACAVDIAQGGYVFG